MIALTEVWHSPRIGRAAAAINAVGLAFLADGVLGTKDLDRHGGLAVAVPLLAASVAAWAVWLAGRIDRRFDAAGPAALALMASAGGALVGASPLALVFPAVASMGITLLQPLRRAAWVVAAGAVAMAISVPVAGRSSGLVLGGLAAMLAATVVGLSRRASQQRLVDEARAEVLAARNHLARELHDVLAHTLSALSLQLEALTALLDARGIDPDIAAKLGDTRRLVRDGLDEARVAVAALREDLPPLDERLAKLAAERQVAVETHGEASALRPEVALALYRVAQEALTNVVKHAPGAAATLRLTYGERDVAVSITNASSPQGQPARELGGGGYGLQGIRERILLLDGIVEAGPDGDGWTVKARVPR